MAYCPISQIGEPCVNCGTCQEDPVTNLARVMVNPEKKFITRTDGNERGKKNGGEKD